MQLRAGARELIGSWHYSRGMRGPSVPKAAKGRPLKREKGTRMHRIRGTTDKSPQPQRKELELIERLATAFRRLVKEVELRGEQAAIAHVASLVRGFSVQWDAAPARRREALRIALQERTLQHLLESDLFHHCYRKPRGYAGDYEAMLKIWLGRSQPRTHRYLGTTRRGQLINAALLEFDNSAANEERVHILKRHILERSGQAIASVGSGPMIEGVQALAEGCSPETRFHLYDQDADALSHAVASLEPFGVKCELHAGNVSRSIVAEASEPSYDLMYSSGLYDYFTLASAQRLTGYVWRRLRAGGSLLITNAHPDNPSRPFMEAAAEWSLRHKTEAEMRALARALPGLERVHLLCDSRGVYQYLRLDKR